MARLKGLTDEELLILRTKASDQLKYATKSDQVYWAIDALNEVKEEQDRRKTQSTGWAFWKFGK